MPSIVTKKIKGNQYLYLVDSIRKGGKVIQKTIKYIGKKRPISQHEFNCMIYSYTQQDWILWEVKEELSYQEHNQMKNASNEYKEFYSNLDYVSKEKEKERFLSRFISESNAIEGSTLTYEETHNFLFNDITPKGHSKTELFMASNLLDAWNFLEKRHMQFPKVEDIKNLHRLVNKGIESDETLGQYKSVQNYIGEVYTTSYLFVEERMKSLLIWIKKAYKDADNFEITFQSHAQFEIIHPFIDGNGRVGRLLLNWLLMYQGLAPLAISRKERSEYIIALNNARKGLRKSICRFCFNEYLKQYNFI